jgi:hypothetical protein
MQGSAPKLTPAESKLVDEFAAELRRQVDEAVKKALAELEAVTAAGGKDAAANSAGEPVKARFPLPARPDGKVVNVADAFVLPAADDDDGKQRQGNSRTAPVKDAAETVVNGFRFLLPRAGDDDESGFRLPAA